MKFQRGTSLTEFMIATALGIWLISGVILSYVSTLKTNQFEQALARIQENGRVITNVLRQNIQMAGYSGCLPLDNLTAALSAGANFTLATRVAGWRNGTSTTSFELPPSIKNNAAKNTDILLIQNMISDNLSIVTLDKDLIAYTAKPDYEEGDLLLVSDCLHSDLVRVKSISGNSIRVAPALQHSYDIRDVQTGYLSSMLYYILRTTRKDDTGKPIFALYRRDLNQPATVPQELLEGVENLRLKFGVAFTDGIHYLPVEEMQSDEWQRVISVEVLLLLNSLNPVTNRPANYNFDQGSYTASDLLLRREWIVDVAIRGSLQNNSFA